MIRQIYIVGLKLSPKNIWVIFPAGSWFPLYKDHYCFWIPIFSDCTDSSTTLAPLIHFLSLFVLYFTLTSEQYSEKIANGLFKYNVITETKICILNPFPLCIVPVGLIGNKSPFRSSSCLGPDSISRWHLTSIGNPIVEIRRSYDRLISTMGFPILVRCHLYIESGPRCWTCCNPLLNCGALVYWRIPVPIRLSELKKKRTFRINNFSAWSP